jgi:hypothetical protein
MSLFLVDIVQPALDEAVQSLKGVSGVGEVHGMKVDVGKVDEVVALREKVLDIFGEVGRLFQANISIIDINHLIPILNLNK